MESIEESPETEEEIKKLEETISHEIEHALNDIDSQIMNLLVQRKIQENLMKNILEKYNKPLSYKDFNKNILNRIKKNYDYNYASYLKTVYYAILKP